MKVPDSAKIPTYHSNGPLERLVNAELGIGPDGWQDGHQYPQCCILRSHDNVWCKLEFSFERHFPHLGRTWRAIPGSGLSGFELGGGPAQPKTPFCHAFNSFRPGLAFLRGPNSRLYFIGKIINWLERSKIVKSGYLIWAGITCFWTKKVTDTWKTTFLKIKNIFNQLHGFDYFWPSFEHKKHWQIKRCFRNFKSILHVSYSKRGVKNGQNPSKFLKF